MSVQSLIDAVASGAVYALVAIGLALIFGVMRLVNFAHGELITAAAYTLYVARDLPVPVTIILAIAVAVAMAWGMERFVFRRLRGVSPETTLIATFAVAIALEAVWVIAFGVRGNRVLTYRGLVSYGLYLYHFAVLKQFEDWIGPGDRATDRAGARLAD